MSLLLIEEANEKAAFVGVFVMDAFTFFNVVHPLNRLVGILILDQVFDSDSEGCPPESCLRFAQSAYALQSM